MHICVPPGPMLQVLKGHKKFISQGSVLSASTLAHASAVMQPGFEWSVQFTARPETGAEVHCCFAMVAADISFH